MNISCISPSAENIIDFVCIALSTVKCIVGHLRAMASRRRAKQSFQVLLYNFEAISSTRRLFFRSYPTQSWRRPSNPGISARRRDLVVR